ncbi:MAG: hypothetical protein C4521_12330 [Actinobacteria bacterium]|nr:MAG: hypothetical protein C4521_12330 [Actinomycetota bacterium]
MRVRIRTREGVVEGDIVRQTDKGIVVRTDDGKQRTVLPKNILGMIVRDREGGQPARTFIPEKPTEVKARTSEQPSVLSLPPGTRVELDSDLWPSKREATVSKVPSEGDVIFVHFDDAKGLYKIDTTRIRVTVLETPGEKPTVKEPVEAREEVIPPGQDKEPVPREAERTPEPTETKPLTDLPDRDLTEQWNRVATETPDTAQQSDVWNEMVRRVAASADPTRRIEGLTQHSNNRLMGPLEMGKKLIDAARVLRPTREPSQMTPEEFLANAVQRIEEPGVGRATVDKPHGLYTTPAQYKSPHEDLGGQRFYWLRNPAAKVLEVDASGLVRTQRGLVGQSAGIAALRHLKGEEEFTRLAGLKKEALARELTTLYPDVEWSRYYDANEMLEGLAGLEARKAGYDAILGTDPKYPEMTEYVGLTSNALREVKPSDIPKGIDLKPMQEPTRQTPIREPEVRVAEPSRAGEVAPPSKGLDLLGQPISYFEDIVQKARMTEPEPIVLPQRQHEAGIRKAELERKEFRDKAAELLEKERRAKSQEKKNQYYDQRQKLHRQEEQRILELQALETADLKLVLQHLKDAPQLSPGQREVITAFLTEVEKTNRTYFDTHDIKRQLYTTGGKYNEKLKAELLQLAEALELPHELADSIAERAASEWLLNFTRHVESPDLSRLTMPLEVMWNKAVRQLSSEYLQGTVASAYARDKAEQMVLPPDITPGDVSSLAYQKVYYGKRVLDYKASVKDLIAAQTGVDAKEKLNAAVPHEYSTGYNSPTQVTSTKKLEEAIREVRLDNILRQIFLGEAPLNYDFDAFVAAARQYEEALTQSLWRQRSLEAAEEMKPYVPQTRKTVTQILDKNTFFENKVNGEDAYSDGFVIVILPLSQETVTGLRAKAIRKGNPPIQQVVDTAVKEAEVKCPEPVGMGELEGKDKAVYFIHPRDGSLVGFNKKYYDFVRSHRWNLKLWNKGEPQPCPAYDKTGKLRAVVCPLRPGERAKLGETIYLPGQKPQSAPLQTEPPRLESFRRADTSVEAPSQPVETAERFKIGDRITNDFVTGVITGETTVKNKWPAWEVRLDDGGKDVVMKESKGYRLAEPSEPLETPVAPKQKPPQTESLDKMEEELGEKIDKVVGKGTTVDVGGSIRIEGGMPMEDAPPYEWTSKTAQAQYEAAKKVPKPTLKETLQTLAKRLWMEFWGDRYPEMPRTKTWAAARAIFDRLNKQRAIQRQFTLDAEKSLLLPFRRQPNIAERFYTYALFRNLKEEVGRQRAAAAEKGEPAEIRLPFRWTPEYVEAELKQLTAEAQKYPQIMEVYRTRRAYWRAVIKELCTQAERAGYDIDKRFTREDYFRHQILEYTGQKASGGKRMNAPTREGYMLPRHGSMKDILTDYLAVETQTLAWIRYNTEVFRAIADINAHYDISGELKIRVEKINAEREAEGKKPISWEQLLPEGYKLHQWDVGHLVFPVDTIPGSIVRKVFENLVEEITPEDLRTMLAIGEAKPKVALPQELIATIKDLKTPRPAETFVNTAARRTTGGWKWWQILSPKRYLKHQVTNASGDFQAVVVGSHDLGLGIFKEAPASFRDLAHYFLQGGKKTPELRDWLYEGGFESSLVSQELQGHDIDALKMWLSIERKRGIGKVPEQALQGYLKGVRWSTLLRESVLRYAAYRHFLAEMRANKGRPRDFGGSIPEEIMAIPDLKTRAYRLSNELLGPYDQVGKWGQHWRKHYGPFWSFKEINLKRFARMVHNAARDQKLAEYAGRQIVGVVTRSPYIAMRLGGFLIRATALSTVLSAYNHLRFPDEEAELPTEVQERLHIVLGRDEDGRVLYFDRLGFFGDLVQWFGLETPRHLVEDWLDGRKSTKDVLKHIAVAPLNTLVQTTGPLKTIGETIAGVKVYPDITEPRRIRDRGYYLAQQFGLGDEYAAVMGLPHRSFKDVMESIVNVQDPGQGAYYDILDEKAEYLKKLGKRTGFSTDSPRSSALYNFRLAVRYGDREAMERYLQMYAELGGTQADLETSFRNLDPLHGLKPDEQRDFVENWLDEELREKLDIAYKFYREVLLGQRGGK